MIAASLVAIGLIGVLLYQYQLRLYQEKVRLSGVAITRALASADYTQLVPQAGSNSLLARLISAQASDDFAYGLVVDQAGKWLYETTQAGRIAPSATMPAEPFAWFGDHEVTSMSDGRRIREFFAPVMKDGALAGFVRLGYYDRPASLAGAEISNLGLMALPVFLLTTLSYFLIRRELKPLERLSETVERASCDFGARPGGALHGAKLGDFIVRFDQFMQLVQSRVQQRDEEMASAQTATRLLSYRQDKAESALNAVPDAVLVIDDTCSPTFANVKAEVLLGASRERIVGRPPHEWCPDKDVLAFVLRFKHAPSTTIQSSIEYVPMDQPERRIAASAFPLFSPRDHATLFGRLIVFRDVSGEFLARQAGADFVVQVSHELKTPLNTLATYSELLLDYGSLEEGERVRAVNVIHSEVERMSGLINNLLNISKLETGTLRLERTRVKLHELLRDSFDSTNSNALGKNIDLRLNIQPDLGSARLDKNLFRIAIDNLLSNAIKYSNPGGSVTLSAQQLDDSQIQISVRDQGIGICANDRKHIFEKYYRASRPETATRSGHGLGLYLAKQIIEQHHGAIAVISEPGKGAEFVVTFKAQPVHLEEAHAA